MTFEQLCEGNSLHSQRIETENEIYKLEEWLDELRNDANITINSYEHPEEKFIVVLHGTKVIPFVEHRLEYLKNHLKELKTKFNDL